MRLTSTTRGPVLSERKGIRAGTIAVALALFAAAVLAMLIALLVYDFLTGAPASEDGDICIGGGHPGYAVALLVVTGAATVTALGGVVQGLRGRRAWPVLVAAAGLLVAAVALVLGLPVEDNINWGQC
jgi:hypothetical protein